MSPIKRRSLLLVFSAALGVTSLLAVAVLVRRAISQGPPVPASGYKVLFDEGVFILKTGLREDAIRRLKQATEVDPDQPMGHYWLARAQGEASRADEALQSINQVMERPRIRRYAESQPNFSDFYNLRGSIKYGLGDYEGSIEDYREGLRRNPENGQFYHNLSMAYLALGELEEALATGSRAQELGYLTSASFFYLGKTYHQMERHEEAEAHFREAILFNFGYSVAYQRLAQSLVRSDRREEGARLIRLGQKLARIDDEISKAVGRLHRADIYDERYREWLEKCSRYCEKYGKHAELKGIMGALVEAYPDVADYHFNAGLAFRRLQEDEEAELSFMRALLIDKQHLDAMNQLSFLSASARDPAVRNPPRSLALARMARAGGYEGVEYLAVGLDANGRTEEARRLVEWEIEPGKAWRGLLRWELDRFQDRLEEVVVEPLIGETGQDSSPTDPRNGTRN